MRDLRDLFVHELTLANTCESDARDALASHGRRLRDPEARDAVVEHLEEALERSDRLDVAFRMTQADTEAGPADGFRGLVSEIDHVATSAPAGVVRDVGLLWGFVRLARYRIGLYEGLVDLADRLEQPDAAEALEETLADEEDFLEEMLEAATRLEREATIRA